MKLRLFLIAISISAISFAGDGLLGTRKESASPASGSQLPGANPLGLASMVQMVVAVLIVAALLKWALPAILSKFGKNSLHSTGEICIEHSAPLGSARLVVVSVEGRKLLLGAGADSVNLLADLTQHQSQPFTTFEEMVEAAASRPTSEHEIEETSTPEAALDRLRRLLK